MLSTLQRFLVPRSSANLGPGRKWLSVGVRICSVFTGIFLIFGLYRQWYWWMPIGLGAVFILAAGGLAYVERRTRA